MSKKTCIILILMLAAVALLCGFRLADDAPATAAGNRPAETIQTKTVSLSIAKQDNHPALMAVNDVGYFQPYYRATIRETCESLCGLLSGLSAVGTKNETLDRVLWADGYRAACLLHNAGILTGDDIRPTDALTRQTLVAMLERIAGCLSGEEAARAAALAGDVSAGVTGKDGTSAGEDIITRSELAVVLVRLTGREPEEAALLIGEYMPVDVSMDTFGWQYIADAVTVGTVERLESGAYRANGALYGVDENGKLFRDMDYGVWTFGPDGKYTTGDAELDDFIAQVLEACGADELSAEEALEAAYLHVKYNYVYLVTPEDMVTEEPGATGWENERALRFFRNGGGTCYGFAAGFGLLARSLGEHAYIVSAQVNEYYAPHGFVVIPEDGVDWIYDVEMEATRQERHKDLALFGIKNYAVYNYWYTPDW